MERLTKKREKEIRNLRTNDRDKCHWGHVGELLGEIDALREEVKAETESHAEEYIYVIKQRDRLHRALEKIRMMKGAGEDVISTAFEALYGNKGK